MELQYKQQPLHNNFMGASYAAGGLQGHTWDFQWGPQGLEQAIKRIGMSPVITQNFSTDPMSRTLSMTYNGATYNGELYFHYDVQGNTSLLTDSNGQAVASFRYDLHSGRIAASWNPNNLEIVNLKNGINGGINFNVYQDIDIIISLYSPIQITRPWGTIDEKRDRLRREIESRDRWGNVTMPIDANGNLVTNGNQGMNNDDCCTLANELALSARNIEFWREQRELLENEGYYYNPTIDPECPYWSLTRGEKVVAGQNEKIDDFDYHRGRIERNLNIWKERNGIACDKWRELGCDHIFPDFGPKNGCPNQANMY